MRIGRWDTMCERYRLVITLTARVLHGTRKSCSPSERRLTGPEMLLVLASRAPGGASSAARTPLHPSGVSGAAYGVAARRGAPRAADYGETHEPTQTVRKFSGVGASPRRHREIAADALNSSLTAE